ncbi:unnamed protein product, partial [Notodromas monacha]
MYSAACSNVPFGYECSPWMNALNEFRRQGDELLALNFQADLSKRLWPNGILYYEFAAGSEIDERVWRDAVKEIEFKTCLRVAPRNGDTNILSYVYVSTDQAGCWAEVGYTASYTSVLNLEAGACWFKGTIVHELLHSFGFLHEHQRADRDNYILVKFENVETESISSFDILPNTDAHDGKYGYDLDSIMHYDSFAFAKTDPATGLELQTIVVKADPNRIIRYPKKLSPGNVEEIHLKPSSNLENISKLRARDPMINSGLVSEEMLLNCDAPNATAKPSSKPRVLRRYSASVFMMKRTLMSTVFLSIFLVQKVQLKNISGFSSRDPLMNPGMVGGDMIINFGVPNATSGADESPAYIFQASLANSRWPSGVLHYEFKIGAKTNKTAWDEAVNEIESKTCLRILPRNDDITITSFVSISTNQQGCWSEVGRKLFSSMLNLEADVCWSKGTILHELLHAFGFLHEHQRSDRDSYITVKIENVEDARGLSSATLGTSAELR